jgi:carbamoyltransferase
MIFLLQEPTHRMLVRHDEKIGFLYVPNLNARLPNELGGYFFKTNAQGFRSECDFQNARRGRRRILFLGDSFLAGDDVANRQRFSDLAGEMLDAEVFNYGLSNSGTDQQLLIYEEFASEVEADLIVLSASVDSIQRIQASHRETIDRVTRRRLLVPKPYFTLESGELRRHNRVVPRVRPDADSLQVKTLHQEGQGRRGLRDALIQWYRTSEQTQNLRRFAIERLAPLQSDVYRLSGTQPYEDYKSASSPGWRLMRAILHRLFTRASPLPILIVPLPPYPFLLHRAKPVYQELYQSLENREAGIHVLDVTSPLTRGPWRERRRLTFHTDPHFSPHGHEQVATLIADTIRRRGLLPARTSRGASPEKAAATPPPPPKRSATRKPLRILGISCFYHDSAASLIEDGKIIAAAEEERFSRLKNDRRFPLKAINYCLEEGGINQDELSAVVYYDNASLTFERILHAQCAAGKEGRENWLRILPSWLQFKLHLPQLIRRSLHYEGLILQNVHHRSHCASAFYPSPFERAAILTVDGVGEWATASIARGDGNAIELFKEMSFPNSLGLLYSAFTQFTGFKVNSDEYKMMGLAPYGRERYVDRILQDLVDMKKDGSLELRLDYFGFLSRPSMTNKAFADLFDGPAREPESRITQREMDIARSIQAVTEEALLRMARHAKSLTGERYLCLAGGVAFNCVANGRLLREGPFDDIWIQPAAGDAGCALGAALDVYHTYFDRPRRPPSPGRPLQRGSCWGPDFSADEIRSFLGTHGYPHQVLDGDSRSFRIAELLAQGKVVGYFDGRMEFGCRALGARSILGDARNAEMQATLNLKIKYRESFRPFAPSVLAEKAGDYFELDRPSPYMQIVSHVKKDRRIPFERGEREDLLAVIREPRSDIPAVTHVDYSARVQTVNGDDHPAYHDVLRKFDERTGTAVIVNTSFNVRGEPIVCTPQDAYRCFMRTEMDALVLGDFLLVKTEQPGWFEDAGTLKERDLALPAEPFDPLARKLEELFETHFLPIARLLKRRGALGIDGGSSGASTTWGDYRNGNSPEKIFVIPPELDTPETDPEAMAQAITRCWSGEEAAKALRPLVARLLRLGARYPLSDSLQEEVEDAVYIMF